MLLHTHFNLLGTLIFAIIIFEFSTSALSPILLYSLTAKGANIALVRHVSVSNFRSVV